LIVVDTNVIAYRFIAGEKTNSALKVEKFDMDWRVPFLWRFEFLNVISTLTKNGIINENQSISIWRNAIEVLAGKEEIPDEEKVLLFSINHGISAYDACYLVLAEILGTKCVTSDKELLGLFPEITIPLDNF
jgi:predicted nucleic acid-binding protein